MDKLKPFLSISPEVQKALETKKPIVSLESITITHDMPYPQNVQTAIRVKDIVRQHGAVPATMAILGGKLRIGLVDEEIEYLGKRGTAVHKASRRDIAALLQQGADGATTAAATLLLSVLAGAKVFAAGGLGGVHRGADATMDISADLEELARTPMLVISAGVRTILNVGMTLEYLETKGVPVIGFGTRELPAFYTRHSGYLLEHSADTPAEIAQMFSIQETLGIRAGLLVANPIPEEYALDANHIDSAIAVAFEEATHTGISGKELTPFLMERLREITDQRTLTASIEVLCNNAKLAAQCAQELSQLQ